MGFTDATMEIARVARILEEFAPGSAFQHEVHYRPAPFKTYFREYFPSKELKDSYGLYFLLDADDRVLYIGKAASQNLFRETWGKFNTPSLGSPLFPNHYWLDKGIPDDVKALIENGDVRIGLVVIDSAAPTSILERHLQKVARETDREFLVLNSRVG